MKMVKSPSEITFHWKCEHPNCTYESDELKFDRLNLNPSPPKKCPKCGRMYPPPKDGNDDFVHPDAASVPEPEDFG